MLTGAMKNAVEGANTAVVAAGEVVSKVDCTALKEGLTYLREASNLIAPIKTQREEAI